LEIIPVSFSLFLILVPAFASTTAPPIAVIGSDNVGRTMAYTAFNNNGNDIHLYNFGIQVQKFIISIGRYLKVGHEIT
jgi:hypothetical protein